ncbi:MAG: hypothetical protein AAF633_13930 [Chloroflexota bacterium]
MLSRLFTILGKLLLKTGIGHAFRALFDFLNDKAAILFLSLLSLLLGLFFLLAAGRHATLSCERFGENVGCMHEITYFGIPYRETALSEMGEAYVTEYCTEMGCTKQVYVLNPNGRNPSINANWGGAEEIADHFNRFLAGQEGDRFQSINHLPFFLQLLGIICGVGFFAACLSLWIGAEWLFALLTWLRIPFN